MYLMIFVLWVVDLIQSVFLELLLYIFVLRRKDMLVFCLSVCLVALHPVDMYNVY
jgi:hypothetical protein